MKGYKQFLNKDDFNATTNNLKVTSVKKTDSGYIIRLFTNYICIYTKYVTTFDDGTAKIVTKVEKNYHPTYAITTYEDKQGNAYTPQEWRKLINPSFLQTFTKTEFKKLVPRRPR